MCFICRNLSTSALYDLNSWQALAHLVSMCVAITRTGSSPKHMGCSWLFFPEFYAVWLTIKCPDLFVAALGSRAPLPAKVDFSSERVLNNENSFCKRVHYLNKWTGHIQGQPNLAGTRPIPHTICSTRILTGLLSILVDQ